MVEMSGDRKKALFGGVAAEMARLAAGAAAEREKKTPKKSPKNKKDAPVVDAEVPTPQGKKGGKGKVEKLAGATKGAEASGGNEGAPVQENVNINQTEVFVTGLPADATADALEVTIPPLFLSLPPYSHRTTFRHGHRAAPKAGPVCIELSLLQI